MKEILLRTAIALTAGLGVIAALESRESDCIGPSKIKHGVALCNGEDGVIAQQWDGSPILFPEACSLGSTYIVDENTVRSYEQNPFTIIIWTLNMEDGTKQMGSYSIPVSYNSPCDRDRINED